MSNKFSFVTLQNNLKMPIIGLGTYKILGYNNCLDVLDGSFKNGYRLIDTAQVYRNEKDIGECLKILLKKYNLTREEIFITSKIAPNNHGYEKCINSVAKTLEDLNVSYVDLFLIHWPGVQGKKTDDIQLGKIRTDTWRGLEYCVKNGYVKSIGVSNYTVKHLNELFGYANIMPMVLQSEFHPYLLQKDILAVCQSNSIVFQAYSSLGTSNPNLSHDLLFNPIIEKIAKKYEKSCAQILLKWSIQQGIAVIPKSTNLSHIEENINIFDIELKSEDIDVLNSLDQNRHLCWNPEKIN